jgi:hypothetical protein
MSLTTIANKYSTDKGTINREYPRIFMLLRYSVLANADKPINLMEIGLNIGGPELDGSADRKVSDIPSVRMWLEYFPLAHIHGVDISDFSAYQNSSFSFYRADCGDSAALQKVAAAAPKCDVIIDDGSHASYHQQLTFLHFFPLLKSGGLYIIEDLDWQPTNYEKTLPEVPKTHSLFEQFLETGHFARTGSIPRESWAPLESQIENVLLVEKDKLDILGNSYNKRQSGGATGYDSLVAPGLFSARHLKEIAVKGIELLRVGYGNREPLRNTVKLAVIQKT